MLAGRPVDYESHIAQGKMQFVQYKAEFEECQSRQEAGRRQAIPRDSRRLSPIREHKRQCRRSRTGAEAIGAEAGEVCKTWWTRQDCLRK